MFNKADLVREAIKNASEVEKNNRNEGLKAWFKALEVLNNLKIDNVDDHQKLLGHIIARITPYVQDGVVKDEVPKAKL